MRCRRRGAKWRRRGCSAYVPHMSVEPVMAGPVYATLGLRNLGPGAARSVALQLEFEPLGDVREFSMPVMPPGHMEQFLLPQTINDLNSAQAAALVTRITGAMEDFYGHRFAVNLVFAIGHRGSKS